MSIEQRPFDPDETPVGLLGFGCGAVGGLMVRGTQAARDRAIARALDASINYFDTGPRQRRRSRPDRWREVRRRIHETEMHDSA